MKIFNMHIGDNITKFPAIYYRLYISRPDNFFGKVAEDNKSNMIEEIKHLKTVG